MADRRLTEAGTVLGRAFAEDPVWNWLLRGSDRERRLTRVFSVFARSAARGAGSQVLVTPDASAAAVWLPPDAWRTTWRETARSAPALLDGMRGGALRGLRLQAALERHHPRQPHWYLELLGTVPEARGKGTGRQVVEPVLDRCDDQRLPAYLESSNPRNWSFYERLGFVGGDPIPVPRGCPMLLPMWREPR